MLRANSIVFSPVLLALLLSVSGGCTVGPDFAEPVPVSPVDWSSAHSGSTELLDTHRLAEQQGTAIAGDWWTVFDDNTLNRLQHSAVSSGFDIRMATLRLAQSRMQRRMTAAQRGPQIDARGGVSRQRSSEQGVNARMLDTLPVDDKQLVQAMSEPFTLYQAGFDASWELDLWGRIRRSVEAADASIRMQQALLDDTRLMVAAEVARNYFEWRGLQQQIAITREDIRAVDQSLQLIQVRADGGLVDDFDVERQRSQLADMQALLPQLLAQETFTLNQLAVLLGVRPGELADEIKTDVTASSTELPDLQLGIPSKIARRRPDIQAAEARLHGATASIGVAIADLYPSVRLGAAFGYESYRDGTVTDWGSRQWSVGPSFQLPVFDRGRRRATIHLRELEQQEAAVNYQQTVLKAWQEIDDALSRYSAERQRYQQLQVKVQSSRQAYQMASARYEGGLTDFLVLLDAQRVYLQARREFLQTDAQRQVALVAVYKAIGGGDAEPAAEEKTPVAATVSPTNETAPQ